MLKRLHIRRFRSIHDATLELGRVNLFIGSNGAGKSNLLEAVGVLSAALGRGLDSTSLAQRGVRLSLPRMFTSSFKGLEDVGTFEIDAHLNGAARYTLSVAANDLRSELQVFAEELEQEGKPVFQRNHNGARVNQSGGDVVQVTPAEWVATRSLWDTHRAVVQLQDRTRTLLDALARYAIYAPQTSVMRGVSIEQNPLTPLGLHGSGVSGAVRTLIKHDQQHGPTGALDTLRQHYRLSDWVESAVVGPPNPEVVPAGVQTGADVVYFIDRFMREGRNRLSPFDASEGTLYLLFVALLLVHPETPPIFALDNVDSTLNPGLVRRLMGILAEAVCDQQGAPSTVAQQVFLTSHNPTALDALDLFNDDHRVFVVHRDAGAHGSTRFFRLRPPEGMTREQWVVSKYGQKLSNLWIDGQLPHALG
ncbi:MAG: AAA family ATPase [Alphaproteobacteria bacterium]|nr:AAA family ATPase [Alphaproteobacteria bacterium]